MHSDFLTVLLMSTPKTLHGSVFPDDLTAAAQQLPTKLQCVRVIHYPMMHIDNLLYGVGDDEEKLREVLELLMEQGQQSRGIAQRLRAELERA